MCMRAIEFKTVDDLYDFLGRASVREVTGASRQTLTNWKADGRIPAAKFDAIDLAMQERGKKAPRHLFAFAPLVSLESPEVPAE